MPSRPNQGHNEQLSGLYTVILKHSWQKSTLSSQGGEHTDKLSQIYTVHCFHVGNYYDANNITQKLPVTKEMKKKTVDKIILQYPSLLWWYTIHEGCCVTL
ncbi:unnamed protein product [Ixodes pacificus]